jgi:uncharacterized protein HemX
MEATGIITATVAIASPIGAGLGWYLTWRLKKGEQDAKIKSEVTSQTADIENNIADKYALRISKLETQVQDLFSKLVDKAAEVGELRGQVTVLKEQLSAAQKDRDSLHLEIASLRAKVGNMEQSKA